MIVHFIGLHFKASTSHTKNDNVKSEVLCDMYKRKVQETWIIVYLRLCEDTLISFIIIHVGIKDVAVNGKSEL